MQQEQGSRLTALDSSWRLHSTMSPASRSCSSANCFLQELALQWPPHAPADRWITWRSCERQDGVASWVRRSGEAARRPQSEERFSRHRMHAAAGRSGTKAGEAERRRRRQGWREMRVTLWSEMA
eukprot:273305-Hanusia_phi.AAC.4